jgi:hypothetical protein
MKISYLPQNNGPEFRIRSLSSSMSNSTMKKPFAKGCLKASFCMISFQKDEIESFRSPNHGENPLKR